MDLDKPSQAMYFSNHLKEGESQIAPIDQFFTEFGAHFGNKLTPIKTFMDMDAVEHVNRTTTTNQCKKKIQFIVQM